MNLKEYRETPDEGMFEQIERRLRLRRMVRVGGVATAVVAVAVVAVVLLTPARRQDVAGITEPFVVENNGRSSVVDSRSQSAPVAQSPSPSVTQSPSAPVTQSSSSSVTQTPSAPVDQSTSTSIAQTPSAPVVQSPSPSVTQTPSAPVAQTPSPSVTQSPNTSVNKSPSTPATQLPSNLLWAPNAIIPASEDENVREFKLVASSAVSDFRLYIYNRGGRQVFTTDDINRAWDATKDGTQLSQGTYVWVAKYRDSDGNIRQEKGTVTVIR